jgi:hypothetical protein
MAMRAFTRLLLCLGLLLGLGVVQSAQVLAATVVVVNNDGAGEGFNDPTPVAPVGGNTGTTLGQQRLIAFQRAAELWGAKLNSPVEIRVGANFDPQACSATSAVLGAAGPNNFFRDFAGAPVAGTWYPVALANALRGLDLDPSAVDIVATFNSAIGTTCAFPNTWYYGLDANPTGSQVDFVTVVLHELGHGIGVVSLVDLTSGAKALGFNDAYMRHLEHHGATPPDFPSMTDAQRVAAQIATGNLHWTGANVRALAGTLSAGTVGDHVRMFAPNPVQPGSSVSHFDTVLAPDQLMEPQYTSPNHDPQLDVALLKDLGWTINSGGGAPANDNFESATVISGNSGTATGTNVGATLQTSEPAHGPGGGTHSVWWRWVAPATGQATFDTIGSAIDTVVAVYAGSPLTALTQISKNDDIVAVSNTRSQVRFHALSGVSYSIAVRGKSTGDTGALTLNWTTGGATTSGLVASVLPYARSVQVGTTATAFATVINASSATATNCQIEMSPNQATVATFDYQTASPANTLTGTPNTPTNIAAGAAQQWVFAITPSAVLSGTDVPLVFDCSNMQPATSTVGVNTFLLSVASTPVPDLIAIGATPSNDGVMRLPGPTGSGAFATAAINIGATGTITASADTGSATLPLSLFICRTNPGTGACLAPPAVSTTSSVTTGSTATYAIFANATGTIAFNPATNRIFLRLISGGQTRGATSVAVTTAASDPPAGD